jgi:hypothetical protein
MLNILLGLLDLLSGFLPPGRRRPNDKTSRLSDWAHRGLFAVNLVIALLCGFAFLLPLLSHY